MLIVKAVCNEWVGEITVNLVKFKFFERSMPLHFFNSDLSYSILELYSQMDRRTSEFQSRTGLQCPPGCGQCCESATPEATVLELLPAAQELFSRREAQQWLERIASIQEDERCVFYQPDPLIPRNGHCDLYILRPSVCRLFGFAVIKNKGGNPELMTCRRQKKENPSSVKVAQEVISSGMSIPSFDYFFFQIATLEHSLGRHWLPINQALQLAIERYGLTVQHTDAKWLESRGKK
jgi:Fe-S-cluster containining protein